MAGNRLRAGKGWPSYGRKDFKKGPAANYRPRKRGPAQTPKRDAESVVADAVEETVASHG